MPHVYDVEQIKEKRKELGISQNKMASLLKINIRTYRRYEREDDMLFSQILKCTEYLKKTEELENNIKNKKTKKTKK